jgi:hypothetical protein
MAATKRANAQSREELDLSIAAHYASGKLPAADHADDVGLGQQLRIVLVGRTVTSP